MRIAIDISQIIYGTGVSHYRQNLVKNLLKIDRVNSYLLFGGSLRRFGELKEKAKELGKFSERVKILPFPPRLASIIWNNLHTLPIEKLIGEVDVVHTSDWAEPPSKSFKITTIHDLIPFKFPKLTPLIIRETHMERLKWVGIESKRIIVPSESTKNDLIDAGFNKNIIRVIPEAPNLSKTSVEEVAAVKRKYSIHGEYIISIGTKPWKNLKRMIAGYHLSKYGENLKYIIVGEKPKEKFEMERGVQFLENVSDYDLSALVTGSKALIFASLYEGFGIPILDGFACETPVVTSFISSMPEVAGKAAVLVDPYDVGSIAEGIKKALNGRIGLVKKGQIRIKNFSWEETARKTLEIYKEVLE